MRDQEILAMLFELAKAIRFCHQDEICGAGISFTEFNIINLICQHRTVNMSELHKFLSVDKSTTTRLVEPLVKKRFVVKEKSSADGRAVDLRLTEEGERVRNEAWECLQGFFAQVEGNIPESKRNEVYDAVRLYAAALQSSCRSNDCCQNLGGVKIT
jgi:DNA-binding MarR family transcriptional regulator